MLARRRSPRVFSLGGIFGLQALLSIADMHAKRGGLFGRGGVTKNGKKQVGQGLVMTTLSVDFADGKAQRGVVDLARFSHSGFDNLIEVGDGHDDLRKIGRLRQFLLWSVRVVGGSTCVVGGRG